MQLKADDGKFYTTDVIDEYGVNIVTALIPSKNKDHFLKWVKGISEK